MSLSLYVCGIAAIFTSTFPLPLTFSGTDKKVPFVSETFFSLLFLINASRLCLPYIKLLPLGRFYYHNTYTGQRL
jgi:hypothetical protein